MLPHQVDSAGLNEGNLCKMNNHQISIDICFKSTPYSKFYVTLQ